jgi:hypothetical protein
MDGAGKAGGGERGYEELYEDVAGVDIGGENVECTEGMYGCEGEGEVIDWTCD